MAERLETASSSLAPTPGADARSLSPTYTNVFQASGSAEELILDFGLDAHRRTDAGSEPTVMLQRLVLTWGHARRLAVMLNNLIQLHDKNHGPHPPASSANPPQT
jgi:hypothetical protein